MMNYIVFIIILFIFATTFYFTTKCSKQKSVFIPYVKGKRVDGLKLGTKLGYSTINLETDINVPCGIYKGKAYIENSYYDIIVLAGKNMSNRIGIHFINFNDKIDTYSVFEIYDLENIIEPRDDFLNTYYCGCV